MRTTQAENTKTQSISLLPPLCTREVYAKASGIPIGVFKAQAERGFWPQVHLGKYVYVNVEAIRIAAARKAEQFTL